ATNAPPLVALLDGFPVANHQLLAGNVEIDDPDDLEARYVTNSSRLHGTSMASLIIHGDTNVASPPLKRRIHVRPVLCCDEFGSAEHFPREQLVVDIIYRAVIRMFERKPD